MTNCANENCSNKLTDTDMQDRFRHTERGPLCSPCLDPRDAEEEARIEALTIAHFLAGF